MALSFLSRLEADKRGLFIEVPSRSTQGGFFGSWPLLFALHFLLTGQMRKRRSYLSPPPPPSSNGILLEILALFQPAPQKCSRSHKSLSPHFHATCSSTQILVICWVIPCALKESGGKFKEKQNRWRSRGRMGFQ